MDEAKLSMTYRPRRFDVGMMRDRVTFQKPTTTADDYGQPVVAWSNYLANIPASFSQIVVGSTETTRGRQVESTAAAVLTTRYYQGITTKMRVVRDGISYGIISVREVDGGKRYLEISLRDADA